MSCASHVENIYSRRVVPIGLSKHKLGTDTNFFFFKSVNQNFSIIFAAVATGHPKLCERSYSKTQLQLLQ